MESFIVSARKYRPNTFDSVVGQSSITTTLRNAIRNEHLAQAFLFCGPRGVGKTTCARILAKTINCFNPTAAIEPCEECESCQSFNEGHSLNIYELDAASNNSVDDIRSLIDQVRFAPQVGSYKVYIIDEVHMLSQAAFNAFLKTLEEPPKHAIFILATTEKHKIIPTILSRCQVFDFNRIQIEDIADHLAGIAEKEGINADQDALHMLAQKADGALRDALSMFDQMVSYSGNKISYESVINNLNILDYDYYFKVTDAILQKNISSALLIFNEILSKGFDGHNFIVGLAEHFRNLLVCRDEQTLQLLEAGQTIKERYKVQAQNCPEKLLLQALELSGKADNQYKSSKNQRLLIELTLMQLCSLEDSPSGTEKKTPAIKAAPAKSEEKQASASKTATPETTSVKTAPQSPPHASEDGEISKKTSSDKNGSLHENGKANERNAPDTSPEKPHPKNSTEAAQTVKDKAPDTGSSATTHSPAEKKEEKSSPSTSGLTSRKWKSATSLKSLSKNKEEKKQVEGHEENTSSRPEEPINEEKLNEAWKKLAEKYEGANGTVYTALTKRTPTLRGDGIIEVQVDNKAQQDELNAQKLEILGFLRKKLANYKTDMQTAVVRNEKDKKAYTPEEKFEKLAQENPNLKAFKDRLDLEINL